MTTYQIISYSIFLLQFTWIFFFHLSVAYPIHLISWFQYLFAFTDVIVTGRFIWHYFFTAYLNITIQLMHAAMTFWYQLFLCLLVHGIEDVIETTVINRLMNNFTVERVCDYFIVFLNFNINYVHIYFIFICIICL